MFSLNLESLRPYTQKFLWKSTICQITFCPNMYFIYKTGGVSQKILHYDFRIPESQEFFPGLTCIHAWTCDSIDQFRLFPTLLIILNFSFSLDHFDFFRICWSVDSFRLCWSISTFSDFVDHFDNPNLLIILTFSYSVDLLTFSDSVNLFDFFRLVDHFDFFWLC